MAGNVRVGGGDSADLGLTIGNSNEPDVVDSGAVVNSTRLTVSYPGTDYPDDVVTLRQGTTVQIQWNPQPAPPAEQR